MRKEAQRQTIDVLAHLAAGLRWLTGLEWLAVAGAAPLLLFPTVRPRWTVVALGALMVLWLLRWLVRREPWPVSPFNGGLLLFALMIPVAMWASALPDLTLPKAAGLILGLAAFRAVALAVRDRRSFSLALVAFCTLGLAIIVVGMLGMQWPTKIPVLGALTDRIPRLFTSLPDLHAAGISPNQLAGALALYLPLAAALVGWCFRRTGSSLHWLVFGACGCFLLLVAGILLLTQSRGGWIGGAAGLLTLWTLWGLSSRRRWMRLLGVGLPLVVFVAVVVGLSFAGPQRVGEVLYGRGGDALVEEVVGEMTLAGRVELWSRALYAIQDFPFTGCGLGTFRRVVQVIYPLFLVGPDIDVAHAHNIFLQTALDVGLPGLVAYLALLMAVGRACWQWARQGAPLARSTALGLLAGLVGLHVYGLADAVALGSKPGVAFWLALGLVAVLNQVGQQGAESEGRGLAGAPLASFTGRSLGGHRWLIAAVLLFGAVLLVMGAFLGWRVLQGGGDLPERSILRLSLYPGAQEVNVRAENPPANSDWVGLLEIATFTTTDSVTDVTGFYAVALAEGGWETNVEAGDAGSWGGIYTRDGGHSVCLLNVFDIEGDTWVCIVCGDKAEPVDLPRSSLPSARGAAALPGEE